jgi:hypothetical protein
MLQNIGNLHGVLLTPLDSPAQILSNTTATLNAAGESVAVIGYVNLSTGPGTSKVLSAAGSGKIHWCPGAGNVFSDAGTTLRLGINDVGATGLEDGTHDVFADLVGGTDTITDSEMAAVTMESGTKTITHGDLIAVVIEMTARGGADSVVVNRYSTAVGAISPHTTVDSGSGPAKLNGSPPRVGIEFDDGTIGWFDTCPPAISLGTGNIGTGSTPDEYALVFQVPFKAVAHGLWAWLTGVSAVDDFEVILYSDPLGTPVAQRTIAQDADLIDTTGNAQWSRPFTSAFTLEPNTTYAVAFRPTTGNTLSLSRLRFGTNGANLRKATMLGTNWSQYSRSDNSGAFGSQDTTFLPMLGVWLGQLSDDVGSGGGAASLIGGSLVR